MIDAMKIGEPIAQDSRQDGFYPTSRLLSLWNDLRKVLVSVSIGSYVVALTPAGENVTVTTEPGGYRLDFSGGGFAKVFITGGRVTSYDLNGSVTAVSIVV